MNENMNYSYDDEVKIDLIHLMFYLLRQWKTLILAVVIGAALGSGIYIMKKNAAEEAASAAVPSVAVEEKDVEELLKNYQVDPDVKNNMELAYQYRQLYRKQLEYNQKSMIMQMDPSKVYCGKVKYYISAGADTALVSSAYESLVEENDFLSRLKNASRLECEEQYIRELVECSVNLNNDMTVNVRNSEGNEAYFTAKNVVVTYVVNSGDEKSCNAMLQVIRDRVAELDDAFRENYPEYEMTVVADSVRLIANSDYLSKQKTNADLLSNYLTNMSKLESAFDEKDLEYYNLAYLSREYESDEDEQEVMDTIMEPEPVNPVKWLVVGILLMCICWGGFYLIKYLLDSSLKTTEEVQSMYQRPLLGCVSGGSPTSRGIDGFLDHLYDRYRGDGDSIDYVAATVGTLKQERFLVCGNDNLDEVKTFMQQLSEKCSKVSLGRQMSQDSGTLEKAKKSDGVILVVQVGRTRRAELQRELEVCRLQEIQIAGIVAVE